MTRRDFQPIHPGEILLEEFLHPMEISQYRLAKKNSVPQRRISEIVHGKRSITADTALRFGRFFAMEVQFWLNLRSRYDLQKTAADLDNRLKEDDEFPKDSWGKRVYTMAAVYVGDASEGEKLLQPLRELGELVTDFSGQI